MPVPDEDHRDRLDPQLPHPPVAQSPPPHRPPHPPVPVLLLQLLSLAHPANCSPFAFGSSYRKQHFNRPHRPDSREGFRLKFCRLAVLIEIGWNPCSHVVQQRGRPQVPYPPNSLASSRAPIWRISIRQRNCPARSRTRSRKSTRSCAVK